MQARRRGAQATLAQAAAAASSMASDVEADQVLGARRGIERMKAVLQQHLMQAGGTSFFTSSISHSRLSGAHLM